MEGPCWSLPNGSKMPEGRVESSVRIAVIDSGVQPEHPHIDAARIAGGASIATDGAMDFGAGCTADRLGHGTAVTAAIQQWAPGALIVPVRIFDRALRTSPRALVAAIDWCADQGIDLLNLSLGTPVEAHRSVIEVAVARALAAGVVVISAREADGVPSYPGALPDVIGVGLDWECARDSWRVVNGADWHVVASGHPRPIPGVPPRRNLYGVSFAVANMTGFSAAPLAGVDGSISGGKERLSALRAALHGGVRTPA